MLAVVVKMVEWGKGIMSPESNNWMLELNSKYAYCFRFSSNSNSALWKKKECFALVLSTYAFDSCGIIDYLRLTMTKSQV